MNRYKGFTLVEVLISIGILSILAALAAPSFTDQLTRWQLNRCANEALAIVKDRQSNSVSINNALPTAFTLSTTVASNADADPAVVFVSGCDGVQFDNAEEPATGLAYRNRKLGTVVGNAFIPQQQVNYRFTIAEEQKQLTLSLHESPVLID